MKALATYLFATLVLLGCKKAEDRGCWKSRGEVVVATHSLAPFQELEISNHINVVLEEAPNYEVTIEAGEHLISFVKAQVVDGILKLEDNNKCDFIRSYDHTITLTVRAPSFQKVTQLGTGGVTTTHALNHNLEFYAFASSGNFQAEMQADSLQVLIEGGPFDVVVSGNCGYAFFYHSGNGNVVASDLSTNTAHCNSVSTGFMKVQSNTTFIGELFSSGDIYYSGSPTNVILDDQGDGEFIAQ